jgi:hypothetical protein
MPRLAAVTTAAFSILVSVDLGTPEGGGRLGILANNVGVARPRTDGFLAVTDEQWLSTLTSTF